MLKVSKIKASEDLESSIRKLIDNIGGFKDYLNKGDTVLIKPNFNTADPFPASSDVGFLKILTELLYENGVRKVIIGESSTSMMSTETVMKQKGIQTLESEGKTQVINFDKQKRIQKPISDGKYLNSVSLPAILGEVDRLILVPCLKTHFLAQYTGSLKLSIGFIKKTEKINMHLGHLQEKVAELNTVIKPDLIIMDGRKCFIDGGPAKGELREPNILLASNDRVAIDVEGMKIIKSFEGNSLSEIDPWDLPQIKRAIELGIGSGSEKDYTVSE